MTVKELINKLLDCPMDKVVSVGIQDEDGVYKYYKPNGFNPETGDILILWEEMKKNFPSYTTEVEFPNDFCIKCNTEKEFRSVLKRLSTNIKEWELEVAVTLMSVISDWLPIYLHMVDGRLVKFSSENQSKSYYDAEDYILIYDAKKGE